MKFKNNDKVKILNKTHTFSGSSNIPNKECIGKIGYVWISDVGNMRVNSKPNDSGDYYGIFNEDELELVNEHNFEVGKWYRIGEWRCKFLRLEGTQFWNTFAMTPYDGYISDNRNNPGYVDYSAHSYPELITDLTEIQQYLPDNHPDKIKEENLVGRYLKALVDYPNSGIVKAGEIGIITKERNGYPDYADFPSQKNYGIAKETFDEGKYEIMPEGFEPTKYVEFLRNYIGFFKKGEIWKEVDYTLFERDGKQGYCSLEEAYKPSTKEAYEAQFKTMEKIEFKKDDYIVLLASCDGGNCWSHVLPINYCYKLREDYDSHHFYPELDNAGSDTNGWSCSTSYDSKMKVRAATPEEIAEYKRLGKPYDVTTLVGKQQSIEDILKEAKRRFPIGCVFKPVLSGGGISDNTYEQTVACYIHKSSSGNWIIGSMNIRSPEGEWAELVSLPEESKSEEYIPKVGDWVVRLNGAHLGIKEGQVAQIIGFGISNQPKLKNQTISEGSHSLENLRPAEPHEIPNESKSEPMNKVKNYTIDEAYDILIQRGFDRVKRYYYRYEDGSLDKDDIRTVKKNLYKGSSYIDFGDGYLWSKEYPHLIADVDMVVEWEEEPESSNKPTYSIEGRQPFTDKSQIIEGNKAIVISECRSRDSENYCRPGSLVTIDENNDDTPWVINENKIRCIMSMSELSPFEEDVPLEGKRVQLVFREEIQIPVNKSASNKHWMLQTTLED